MGESSEKSAAALCAARTSALFAPAAGIAGREAGRGLPVGFPLALARTLEVRRSRSPPCCPAGWCPPTSAPVRRCDLCSGTLSPPARVLVLRAAARVSAAAITGALPARISSLLTAASKLAPPPLALPACGSLQRASHACALGCRSAPRCSLLAVRVGLAASRRYVASHASCCSRVRGSGGRANVDSSTSQPGESTECAGPSQTLQYSMGSARRSGSSLSSGASPSAAPPTFATRAVWVSRPLPSRDGLLPRQSPQLCSRSAHTCSSRSAGSWSSPHRRQ